MSLSPRDHRIFWKRSTRQPARSPWRSVCRRCCSAYLLSLSLTRRGDNAYANYSEANRAFWRQTVLPLVQRLARALSGWLAPAYGGELRLAPDLDAVEARRQNAKRCGPAWSARASCRTTKSARRSGMGRGGQTATRRSSIRITARMADLTSRQVVRRSAQSFQSPERNQSQYLRHLSRARRNLSTRHQNQGGAGKNELTTHHPGPKVNAHSLVRAVMHSRSD